VLLNMLVTHYCMCGQCKIIRNGANGICWLTFKILCDLMLVVLVNAVFSEKLTV
jgi:hypothetical protein